jgi:hypothetical protein
LTTGRTCSISLLNKKDSTKRNLKMSKDKIPNTDNTVRNSEYTKAMISNKRKFLSFCRILTKRNGLRRRENGALKEPYILMLCEKLLKLKRVLNLKYKH